MARAGCMLAEYSYMSQPANAQNVLNRLNGNNEAAHASAARGAVDGGQNPVVSGLDGGRLSALDELTHGRTQAI